MTIRRMTYERARKIQAKSPFKDVIELAAACERIVDFRGEVKTYPIVGYCGLRPKVFETETWSVAKDPSTGLMEIAIKEPLYPTKGISNPFYMRSTEGDVIRTHGDWMLVVEEVQKALKKLPKVKPQMLTEAQRRVAVAKTLALFNLVQERADCKDFLPELFECGDRNAGWVRLDLPNFRTVVAKHSRALLFREGGKTHLMRGADGTILYASKEFLGVFPGKWSGQ